jgi:hypothetical protein
MAMDIVSKEKKEIRWKGLPTNAQHDRDALEREHERLQISIARKREHLGQLMEQQVCVCSFLVVSFVSSLFCNICTYIPSPHLTAVLTWID